MLKDTLHTVAIVGRVKAARLFTILAVQLLDRDFTLVTKKSADLYVYPKAVTTGILIVETSVTVHCVVPMILPTLPVTV